MWEDQVGLGSHGIGVSGLKGRLGSKRELMVK